MQVFTKLKYKIINFLTAKLAFNNVGGNVVLSKSAEIRGTRLFGTCNIGDNSQIRYSSLNGKISVGTNCKLNNVNFEGVVIIGNYTSAWGPNINFTSSKDFSITIGNYCSIAKNVTIQTYNHNHKKITTYYIGQNIFNEQWENEKISNGNVIIENDVWIGAGVTILSGVTIANGAVVAANAVVTKPVPPYAIVAGIPAKIIGYRFSETVVEGLQKLAWWNWDIDKINEHKSLFASEHSEEKLLALINELS